jgi:hypothetical protein
MNLGRFARIPRCRARKLLRVLYGPEAQIAAERPAKSNLTSVVAVVSPPLAASAPHPLPRPHFASNRRQPAASAARGGVVTGS